MNAPVAGDMTDMSTQIERVDDLYMSSELAAKAKHSTASLALHRAQLKGTQAALAKIKHRHVFRLMDLPEEVRRVILVMLVRSQCDLREFHYKLPAITAVVNEQLRQETILAALQNNVLDLGWGPEMTQEWLPTVNFGVLQKIGFSCPRDGLGAIRTADVIWRDTDTTRFLGRLENLRDLLVIFADAAKMFGIGSDYSISGDALGASVRECDLDLPSLDLRSLRKLTIIVRFNYKRHEFVRDVEPYVPDWRDRIEEGCKKVAGWLSKEYSARGQRVTIVIQTELGDDW
jgi:hypothetical protein